MPALTVVIATYNRPEVLALTLRCLSAQSCRDWQAIVVGDHCDARTAQAVESLADPRVRYVNLPLRCGEQSGPNNIGATYADTRFLAFLNHDDLLLPDHFAALLERMSESEADACVSRVIRGDCTPRSDGTWQLTYHLAPSPLLSAARVATATYSPECEPVSAWVFTTAAYRRAGDWASAASLYRTPFNEWLLRLVLGRARIVRHEYPTVVNMQTHIRQMPRAPTYTATADFNERVAAAILGRTAESFRTDVARASRHDAEAQGVLGNRWIRFRSAPWRQKLSLLAALLVRTLGAPLRVAIGPPFVWALRRGIDPYDTWCRILGRHRGFWRSAALKRRTGSVPPPVTYAELRAALRDGTGGRT